MSDEELTVLEDTLDPLIFFTTLLEVLDNYLCIEIVSRDYNHAHISQMLSVYSELWRDFNNYLKVTNGDINNYQLRNPADLQRYLEDFVDIR